MIATGAASNSFLRSFVAAAVVLVLLLLLLFLLPFLTAGTSGGALAMPLLPGSISAAQCCLSCLLTAQHYRLQCIYKVRMSTALQVLMPYKTAFFHTTAHTLQQHLQTDSLGSMRRNMAQQHPINDSRAQTTPPSQGGLSGLR
jgi:hypothetical protein